MTVNKNGLTFLSLWAINGELQRTKLWNQLKEMKRLGMQGTIFHPRYYPGKPEYLGEEYLEILSDTIIEAKKIGLEFWIYDENGWPSGSANGEVFRKFPDSHCQWLDYQNDKVVKKSRPGFNTFQKDQVEFFLEYTYEGYRKGLAKEAFDHITGFFSDEVGFLDGHGESMHSGGIPWCEEASERFEIAYGQPLEHVWQMLFVKEEGYTEVRERYWHILSDILSESFYKTINDWCVQHKKRYTAHLKGEENLFFQTSCSGSLYQNLKYVNMPAVDALERYPGNYYYPKCASSLSKQFSDGQCLTEALGGSGWGLTPENISNYVDWLAECGISTIAFHLWQYEKSSASVRDWPPDIPCGLSFREAAPDLFKSLREKWYGKIITHNSVLIIAPERGVMAEFNSKDAMLINEHNGANTPESKSGRISSKFAEFVEHCHAMGILFDVCSERILEEYGKIEQGNLCVGKEQYSAVICGFGARFSQTTIPKRLKTEGIWYEANEWEWNYAANGGNQIMLHNNKTNIPYYGSLDYGQQSWNIRAQDSLQSVFVNETELKEEKEEDYYIYKISDAIQKECIQKGTIPINIVSEEINPFAFLEGNFLVKNKSSYEEKDAHQWKTDGKFYLSEERDQTIVADNLIASGFPFCRTYVELESYIFVGKSGTLTLDSRNLHADCVLLILNNKETKYLWGPKWKAEGIFPGIHKVHIRLYPSTYNTYGPHHHWEGDRHLTSPMQYSGEKGFADSPSAPQPTLVTAWHFVKYGI